MKTFPMRLKPIFCMFTASMLAASCSRMVPCNDTLLNEVWINNPNGINDTVIDIKSYKAGSNFTTLQNDATTYRSKGYYYQFQAGYEYIITVIGTGRTHKLKDISKGSEKMRTGNGYQSDICHFSVSYTIDDSLVFVPVQHGNSAYALVYITN